MRIAIGSEHRAYRAKSELQRHLEWLGHDVADFGSNEWVAADCVDVAWSVAGAVARGDCEIGILISGSGIGMCMKANKISGIRAAVVHDEFSARRTREKHHCNVLCLSADLDGAIDLKKIIDHFLATTLDPEREPPIVKKLAQIEQMSSRTPFPLACMRAERSG